jgi:hypothetical protein
VGSSQLFEQLLGDAGNTRVRACLSPQLSIHLLSEQELADATDRETANFLRVVGERALDGIVCIRLRTAGPDLPRPAIDQAKQEAVKVP